MEKLMWADSKSESGSRDHSPDESLQEVSGGSVMQPSSGTARFASNPLCPLTLTWPAQRATPRRGQQPQTLAATASHYRGFSRRPPAAVFSRKVFLGGLPRDINIELITQKFRPYGELVLGWPRMDLSKSRCPLRGFAFLQFEDESCVHRLIEGCLVDGPGFYTLMSSPTVLHKPVQVKPWKLSDAEILIESHTMDVKKTVFVGGVPGQMTAFRLAQLMATLFGNVCYAGIDVDLQLGYPMGSGRVTFRTVGACVAAITARFVQVGPDVRKRVEVKPYIVPNQPCEHCCGAACANMPARYFCVNVACLKYLCILCWSEIHREAPFSSHKPHMQKNRSEPYPCDHQAPYPNAASKWQR